MATGKKGDPDPGADPGALSEFETRTGRAAALAGAALGVLGIVLVLVGAMDPAGGLLRVTRSDGYLVTGGVALVLAGTVLTYLTRRAAS